MEKAEAQYHFHEANRLYQEGHCLEALQYLADLNRAYPHTFNILFPMLLCRHKLGRIQEAYAQCAEMLEQFPEDKHQQRLRPLFGDICRDKARLAHEIGGSFPAAGGGIINDPPQVTVLDKSDLIVVGNMEIPWKKILFYVAVIGVFILLLALVPLIISQAKTGEHIGLKILAVVLILSVQFAMTCLVTYTALWALSKLIHEEMLRDFIDIAISMVIFSLLCFIPFIGIFLGWYYLAQHYDMSFGEVLIFLLLQIVFQVLFLFGILPMVLGENALLIIDMLW